MRGFEILKAKNGYCVFLPDHGRLTDLREPWVFETIDKALAFIKDEFNKTGSAEAEREK